MSAFVSSVIGGLKKVILRVVWMLNDFLSLKVQFSIGLWFLTYLSGFSAVMVISSALVTILSLFQREIQKPNSNIAEILKVWLGRG